jgi:hypothetical protein
MTPKPENSENGTRKSRLGIAFARRTPWSRTPTQVRVSPANLRMLVYLMIYDSGSYTSILGTSIPACLRVPVYLLIYDFVSYTGILGTSVPACLRILLCLVIYDSRSYSNILGTSIPAYLRILVYSSSYSSILPRRARPGLESLRPRSGKRRRRGLCYWPCARQPPTS